MLIWKGLAVLSGAAGLVILGVLAVAMLTVPDEPGFGEVLEGATQDGIPIDEVLPTAIGGELTVSGAREGTIVLESTVDGPSFGLGDSRSRFFFETEPLTLSQASHDGLTFFPETDDCSFTTGRHNEEAGIVAVEISCAGLVDIRGNGTLAVEGHLALPAAMVVELGIPESGGRLTVGDETWEVVEPILFLGDFGGVGGAEGGNGLWLSDADHLHGVFLEYEAEGDRLRLASVSVDGEPVAVDAGTCTISDEEVMALSPEATRMELDLACQDVAIAGVGVVDIQGTILYDRVIVLEP